MLLRVITEQKADINLTSVSSASWCILEYGTSIEKALFRLMDSFYVITAHIS